MTDLTAARRKQFAAFCEQVLQPETAVQGVVVIGSLASGHVRPDSDIDVILFLDPLDHYIVPAEAIWDPEADTFHSIFSDDAALRERGLQLDFVRLPWAQWSANDFEWPEGRKAELSAGWVALDRDGQTADLIARKTAYDEEARLVRLDEAIVWLDQHLNWNGAAAWEGLGTAVALDRLEAAYHYLVQALFALNRRWRPWRNREMQALLTLPWLPPDFETRVLIAANAPSLDEDGYRQRLDALKGLFNDVLHWLSDNGDYSPTPIDQAFMRSAEEPGRAWNMGEWTKFRQARRLSAED